MADALALLHASDLHGNQHKLGHHAGDILVVSGDLSRSGTRDELLEVLDWIAAYPCAEKIIIPGNHDRWAFDHQPDFAGECAQRSILLPLDRSVTLEGLHFYGMPWVAHKPEWNWEENNAAWAVHPDDPILRNAIESIPASVQVLVTHAPPRGIGDLVSRGSYFHSVGESSPGCPHLRSFIDASPTLKLCLFGHVHDATGIQRYQNVWFSNASQAINRFLIKDDRVASAGILEFY